MCSDDAIQKKRSKNNMSEMKNISGPEIVVTMGDPSGIGPEVVAKSLKILLPTEKVSFTVVGDGELLSGVFGEYCPEAVSANNPKINFVDPGGSPGKCISGKPDEEGAMKAFRSIEEAVRLVSCSKASCPKAIVTAPVSKENIARVHKGFVGHTEFLQEAFNSDFVTMVFLGDHLRVVPVTRHVALRNVAGCLTKELVFRTIEQVIKELCIVSDTPNPTIIVTALNPHAGEGGRMGDEEKTIIEPVVKCFSETYPAIEGPLPSDVAFYRALSKPGSIVIAMYHDQCLGPFKMLDFNNGVNLTLGLGVVRTSPDHGTAFNIAGKGIADPGSMIHAIKLAIKALQI